MAKNMLQDIVPPEKRSIRNIPLPKRVPYRRTEGKTLAKEEERVVQETSPNPPKQPPSGPKIYSYGDSFSGKSFDGKGRKVLIFSLILAAFIIVFAVASVFTKGTIVVTPISSQVTGSEETLYTAKRVANAEELGFELLKLTKNLGKDVTATGEEEVERKASGQIVIFNNFDSSSQRLIKNTRFETPEGLIYRINESIVVPGKKVENGQSTPGSIEVTVYADEAGEKYNIGKKDFTIPGFKNDPSRYKEIYARSKTDMSGGFVGKIKKVSETDLNKARSELQAKLESELTRDAEAQMPENLILFKDATIFSFSLLPQTDDTGTTVTINEEGTLYGILFQEMPFIQYIAANLAPDLVNAGMALKIDNIRSLSFSIIEKNKLQGPDLDEVKFKLVGPIDFVANINENLLKSDVAGKTKKELPAVFSEYKAIKDAYGTIRPFWKRTFPEDVGDISIKIKNSK